MTINNQATEQPEPHSQPTAGRDAKARQMMNQAMDLSHRASSKMIDSRFHMTKSEPLYMEQRNRLEKNPDTEGLDGFEDWLLHAIVSLAGSLDRLALAARYAGVGYNDFDANLADAAGMAHRAALKQRIISAATADPTLRVALSEGGNFVEAWRDPPDENQDVLEKCLTEEAEWPEIFWPDLVTREGAPNGGPLLSFEVSPT